MSSETTRIIRTKHDAQNKYFLVARETAQDTNLSYEALGVLIYLLSKPDDWTVRVTDLQKRVHGKKSGYGRGSIASIMRELCKAGYAELKFIRDPKTRHMTGREYLVYETPIQSNTDQPDSGRSAIPTVEEIAPIHNTDSLQSTEEHSAPNGTHGKSPKAKAGKVREVDPYFEAIATVWHTRAGGFIGGIKSMMLGKATGKSQYAKGNFDEPVVDPQEILDFGVWAWKRVESRSAPNNGQKPELPTYAVTIQKWFYDFRDDRRAHAVTPAAPTPEAPWTTSGDYFKWRAKQLESGL